MMHDLLPANAGAQAACASHARYWSTHVAIVARSVQSKALAHAELRHATLVDPGHAKSP